jgi:hypothetical protein
MPNSRYGSAFARHAAQKKPRTPPPGPPAISQGQRRGRVRTGLTARAGKVGELGLIPPAEYETNHHHTTAPASLTNG